MNRTGETCGPTARSHGVALLDVLAGFGRVGLAAVGAAQVLQSSVEGLECGVDPRVGAQRVGRVVGQRLVPVELREGLGGCLAFSKIVWGTAIGVVVEEAGQEVLHASHGGSRGPWGSDGARVAGRTLTHKEQR